MDAFVTRGGAPASRGGAARPKPRRARQATLESLAKVVVMPTSTLGFAAEDLERLKLQLESEDASASQLLDALRVLSSLVISRADLEASMVGRSVNRLLKRSTHAEVSRVAGNLVEKWRREVERANAARDAAAGGRKRSALPLAQPRAPPRPPLMLRDDGGASLDAELASFACTAGAQRRRSSGGGVYTPAAPPLVTPTQREQWRAAFRGCLEQGGTSAARIAASLEAAVYSQGAARFGGTAEMLRVALTSNASLRAALLSGWLAPADAAALTGRALMSSDFLAGM